MKEFAHLIIGNQVVNQLESDRQTLNKTLLENWQIFAYLIIGSQGIPATFAFIFFTIFGMLFVKMWRYNKKKKLGKKQTPIKRIKFSWRIWLDDNLFDFVLAFMMSFASFRFFPDALSFVNHYMPNLPEFSDKMFYGLLLGLAFQFLFHKLMNGINIKIA